MGNWHGYDRKENVSDPTDCDGRRRHGGRWHFLAAADLRQRHRSRGRRSSRGSSPVPACTCWRACSSRWPSASPTSMPAYLPMPRPASATIPAFLSAFGYWIGSCIGNVSYWVLIKSTLGAFFPSVRRRQHGDRHRRRVHRHLAFHFMILKGIQQAAFINSIVTVAKIIPIMVFIVIMIFAFKMDLFRGEFLRRRLRGRLFGPGAGDDAGDGVRLPRHRRGERLLALSQKSARMSARRRS